MSHLVVIDVETTDLEPSKGEIIEVAALRYDRDTGQEFDRFVRLCKPSTPIGFETTSITGITNEMVAAAEPFSVIVEELAAFIGDAPLLAHNASFDRTWLSYHGLSIAKNIWFDSFALAFIAWPEAASYNLVTLVTEVCGNKPTVDQGPHYALRAPHLRQRLRMGMARGRQLTTDLAAPSRGEHSAAYDCEQTWQLFRAIEARFTVSAETKGKMTTVFGRAGLDHYSSLLRVGASSNDSDLSKPLDTAPRGAAPGMHSGELAVADILAADGLLERNLPSFHFRAQQLEMATIVTEAIANEESAIIEAPTGTGKTFAYVVPSLLAAAQGKRVVLSTHTKHLQDQLIDDDIPRLNELLGTRIRYTSLKGRRNYICEQRLLQLLQRPQLKEEDALLLAKVLFWLERGGSGDLTRLSLSHQRSELVWYMHADATSCRLLCDKDGTCPYQRARRAAEGAQMVVVNHALLTRMTTGKEMTLSADVVVIDEAHQLETAARTATEISFSDVRLRELLAPVLQVAQEHPDQTRERHLIAETKALLQQYRDLVAATGTFVQHHAQRDSLRLSPGVRRSASWQRVVEAAQVLDGRLKFIIGLSESMAGSSTPGEVASAQAGRIIADAVRELTLFSQDVSRFFTGDPARIQWVEVRKPFTGRSGDTNIPVAPDIILHDVALSVATTIAPLLQTTPSVILTSATLAVGDTFDYIQSRLGFTPTRAVQLTSPFTLAAAMGICIATDAPTPNTPDFDRYVAATVAKVSAALGGRTLVLLTSRAAVRSLFRTLNRQLSKATIKLYAQDVNGGRANLVRRFRQQHRSVLLGTDSFWEGIDIPGESLSCVIIPKLPFANPYDPVLEAVAEAEQLNAFQELAVPAMILKLRQGLGRLIRSDEDRGLVFILDSRIHGATYGDAVVRSLPQESVVVEPSKNFDQVILDFFGKQLLDQWHAETDPK